MSAVATDGALVLNLGGKMANINGIEIKAIKTFLGTEGYARQGNVYLDKKKIGFFSEDGNGGCDWIGFECLVHN